jgi:hypothetical protein
LLLLPGSLAAAGEDVVDSARTDSAAAVDSLPTVKVDTVLYRPSPDVPLAARVTNPADLEQTLTQNPTAALFKSMIVPGLGQLGNRRYTKAALVIGVEAWLFGTAFKRNGEVGDAREAYLAETDYVARSARYFEYDTLRKSRNKYLWFGGLTIFLSMFDAYVDAHLSGSPADTRNDRFNIGLAPDADGGMAAQVSFSF